MTAEAEVFVSRTHGRSPDGAAGSMRAQAACALARIAASLASHGMTLRDVVSARYLVPHGSSPAAFAACRNLVSGALRDPAPLPTYVAAGLALPGAQIEIEVRARPLSPARSR
jgi:enamine deaminase RidA (YjgF/YER057c/UK114 family)